MQEGMHTYKGTIGRQYFTWRFADGQFGWISESVKEAYGCRARANHDISNLEATPVPYGPSEPGLYKVVTTTGANDWHSHWDGKGWSRARALIRDALADKDNPWQDSCCVIAWVSAEAKVEQKSAKPSNPLPHWVNWLGGECPVAGDSAVDFRLRSGDTYTGRRADSLCWLHGHVNSDIVAFQTHNPNVFKSSEPSLARAQNGRPDPRLVLLS